MIKTTKKKPFVNLTKKNSDGTNSYDRIINAYYAYYNTPTINPFFVEPLKDVIKRNKILKVSISQLINKQVIVEKFSNNPSKPLQLQSKVWDSIIKRAQHEIIHNAAFIPIPLGMGELSLKEGFQGMYSSTRVVKDEKTKEMRAKTTRRYATNTKGRLFKLVWYKAKCIHSHARYYKFVPCIGGIDLENPYNPIYYGTQGIAARIAELSMNPLQKDYTGNYI